MGDIGAGGSILGVPGLGIKSDGGTALVLEVLTAGEEVVLAVAGEDEEECVGKGNGAGVV